MRTSVLLLGVLTVAFPLAAENPLVVCKTYDGRECGSTHSAPSQETQSVVAATAIHVLPAIVDAFREGARRIDSYKAMCGSFLGERGLSEQEYEFKKQSLRKELDKEIESSIKAMHSRLEKSFKADEGARKTALENSKLILEKARRETKESLKRLDEERKNREQVNQQIALEKAIKEAGGLPEPELLRRKGRLIEAIYDPQNIDDAVIEFQAFVDRYLNAKSDLARNQLKDLVDELRDETGLVKPWLDFAPALKSHTFQTSPESNAGKELRSLANKALGLARLAENDAELVEKVEYLIETITRADQYLGPAIGSNVVYQKRLGDRYLQRSRDFYRFTNPHADLSPYSLSKMPKKAIELFGLNQVNVRSFSGLEIQRVADHASHIPNIESNELTLFYLTTILQQAQDEANAGDWRSAVQNVDRAWAVVDYAKGFVTGVGEFVEDTVGGLADLVLHPIDSVQGIARAVINYDKTYDAIVTAMQKVWNEYPNYTVEEKGKFWGRATGEVLSAVYGGSLVKLAKDAKVVAGVAEAARFIELASEAGPGRLKYLSETSWVTNVYGPLRKGPLHMLKLSEGTVADTFRSSTYVEVITQEPVKLYRVWDKGISDLSPYWSRAKPTGPLQAQLDFALNPTWGNGATRWTEITVPVGETFYEGAVSDIILKSRGGEIPTGRLLGGGNQVYINQEVPRAWVTATGVFQ